MKTFVITCVYMLCGLSSFAQQLVSSNPSHLSTSVELQTEISFTFDKALNVGATIMDSGAPLAFLGIAPEDSLTFDETSISFSNDNKTLSVSALHTANTFYTWVLTGAVFADGDSLLSPAVIRYTTAASYSGVSASGTVSNKYGISNENVVVALLDGNPFEGNEFDEPEPVAAALTSQNGNFTIPHVPNGTYWPVAVVDVNGDSEIDHGDFMGFFDPLESGEPQAIEINSNNAADIAIGLNLMDRTFNMPEFTSARAYFDAVNDSAMAISPNYEFVFAGMFIYEDTLQSDGIAPGWYYSFYHPENAEFMEIEVFDGKVTPHNVHTKHLAKVRSEKARHKIPTYVLEEEWVPRTIVDNWIDSPVAAQAAIDNGAQAVIDMREMPMVFMTLMGEYHLSNETNDIVSAWRYEVDNHWNYYYENPNPDQPNRSSDSFWIDASNGTFLRYDSGDYPNPTSPFSITSISIDNYQSGIPLNALVSISFSEKLYLEPESDFPALDITSPDPEIDPFTLVEWYFTHGDSTLNLVANLEADTDYSLIIEGGMSANYGFLDSVYIRNFTTAASFGERTISGKLLVDFEEEPMQKWLEKNPTARLNDHEGDGPYRPISPIVVLANENPFEANSETARILTASQATLPDMSYEINNVRPGTYYPIAYMPTMGMVDDFFPLFFIYDTDGDGLPDPIEIAESDMTNVNLVWGDFFVLASTTAKTYVDEARIMATEISADYELKYVYSPSFGPNETGRSLVWYYIFYSESLQENVAIVAESFGDMYSVYGFDFDFNSLIGFIDFFGEEEDPYINKNLQENDMETVKQARTNILKSRASETTFEEVNPSLVPNFVDSDIAVSLAMDNGAATFIEENFVLLTEMVAGYSTDYPENAGGIWRISFYSIGFEGLFDITYFDAFIDAETGTFLGAESGNLFEIGGMSVVEASLADFTANVDLNTTISLRFSQAILPFDDWEEIPVALVSPNENSNAQLNNWYLSDSDSTINFDVSLVENTDYSLVILFAVGKDGGVMISPYTLNFSTYSEYGTISITGNVEIPENMPGEPEMGYASPKLQEALGKVSQFNAGFEDGILVGLMSDSLGYEGGDIVYASKTTGTELSFAIHNVRPGDYFPFAFATTGFDNGGMEMMFVYRENGRPAKITVTDTNIENLTLEMFVGREDNGVGHHSELGREYAEDLAQSARNQMRLQFMVSDGHVDSLGNSPGWMYVFSEENYDSLAFVMQTPFGDSLFFATHDDAGAPRSNRYLPNTTISSQQAMNVAHELVGRNFLYEHPNAFVEMMAGDIPIGVDGVRHQNLAWITMFYPSVELAKSFSNVSLAEKLALSDAELMENEIKVVSLDVESGELITLGTNTSNELAGEMPKKIALAQNFPNPFNPTTQIQFSLPESMHIKLNVYDILGRNVANLVNGLTNAGNHSISFDAQELSSGLYIYQLEAGNSVITKKMMLMK